MIDTHCHLDFPPFSDNPTYWLANANEQGVTGVIVPAVARTNWQAVSQLSHDFPRVYYALGLHPVWDDKHDDTDIDLLADALQARSDTLIAVGECGLDFSFVHHQKNRQIARLHAQFNLAVMHDLPVILHCRKAHNELLQQINLFPRLRGVLHGFSGSEAMGREFIKRGFLLGIGGTFTYPRANKTRKAVAALPLKGLVLETDAPDMPIYGFQGEANLPERLPLIANELAKLKNIALPRLHTQITANVSACFKFPSSD